MFDAMSNTDLLGFYALVILFVALVLIGVPAKR